MGRPTDSLSIMRLIDNRKHNTGNYFASTFIVGFPTETDADYMQLLDFIKAI